MTIKLSQTASRLCAVAGCAAFVLISGAVTALPGLAQTAPPAAKKTAAKTKPAEADAEPAGSEASRETNVAWRDYDAGVQLLRTAQPEAAAAKFSNVLAGANVPGPLMAKTLLQRGIAYRQEGKPAQAVADLTSAMFLRNGLTDSEKADAAAQRSAAYREAGLSEQGVSTPDQNRSAVVATASSGNTTRVASSGGSGAIAGLAPGAEAQVAPSNSGFFGKLFSSSEADAAPVAASPAPAPAAVSAWSPDPVATANVPPDRSGSKKSGAKTAAVNGGTELLPWERPAGAPPTDEAKPTVKAKVPKAAADTAAKVGAPAGRLRLQLAAVLSREEAQATAARIKSQFAGDIGSRAATIDEAALGADTMYIVRFGPYASTAEIKALCTRIRAAGTDCLQAP